MISYKSKSGKVSGVTAYKIEIDRITIEFDSKTYVYTNASAGYSTVEKMKRLALESRGLSTFIAQNNPGFLSKH